MRELPPVQLLLPLLPFVLFGCSGEQGWPSLAPGDDPVRATEVHEARRFATNLNRRLKQIPSTRIGALEGSGPDIIGTIAAVTPDDRGNVIILDQDSDRLLWFTLDGVFGGAVGGSGDGPGEMRNPRYLFRRADGVLRVVDTRNRKILQFGPIEAGLEYQEGDIRYAIAVDDLCELDGRLFLHTPRYPMVIREIDGNGEVLQEFAEQKVDQRDEKLTHLWDGPMGQMMREAQNEGRLLCTTAPPQIILVSRQMPWVRAFDLSGRLVWESSLGSIHSIHFINPSGSTVGLAPDPNSGTAHYLEALALLDGSRFAATFREYGLRDREGSLEIRILSLHDGHESGRLTGVPVGISGVTEEGDIVGFNNYPFPHVAVFRGVLRPNGRD